MDTEKLLIAFLQYRYLKDTSGYPCEYQAKLEAALDVVQDAMISDIIDEAIYNRESK